MKVNKCDVLDVVRATLFSLIIALVMILIAALILQFTDMPDSAVMPINIAIKILSLVGGCLIGIRSCNKGALKGVIIGLFTLLFTFIIYLCINGGMTEDGMTYIDAITMEAAAIVSGVIAVNVKGRHKE